MVLVSSVGYVSDYESFQLAVLIVQVRVRPGAECAKITYSMRVGIAISFFVNGLMRVRWEGEEKLAFICLCISTLWKPLKHSPFRPIAIRVNAISTNIHASNYNHFSNLYQKGDLLVVAC